MKMKKKDAKTKPKSKRDIKKELLTRGSLEECVKDIFMVAIRRLNAAEQRINKSAKLMTLRLSQFIEFRDKLIERLDGYEAKMESMEDSFYTLYHNIKKNQFLYADKPEVWWDDYLDLKKHYNEEMEKEA